MLALSLIGMVSANVLDLHWDRRKPYEPKPDSKRILKILRIPWKWSQNHGGADLVVVPEDERVRWCSGCKTYATKVVYFKNKCNKKNHLKRKVDHYCPPCLLNRLLNQLKHYVSFKCSQDFRKHHVQIKLECPCGSLPTPEDLISLAEMHRKKNWITKTSAYKEFKHLYRMLEINKRNSDENDGIP